MVYKRGHTHTHTWFLPARHYASAGLCDSDVSVCLSVCHTPVLWLAERKQDLPRVQDCFDSLSGASWFCQLDLTGSFSQVPLEPQE